MCMKAVRMWVVCVCVHESGEDVGDVCMCA